MQEIKLNLGCGRNVLPGWVNLDNSPSVLLAKVPPLKAVLYRLGVISKTAYETEWPKGIVWRNLSKGIPYRDETVDKIYSSHLLEHLEKERGEFLLGDCFRVLKKGGVFRLVVPDLAFHARRYLESSARGDSVGRDPHDDFLRNIYGAYLEKKRYGASHRYMYDWPTLRLVLNGIGFRGIGLRSYQQSCDLEMGLLDNRPEESLHIDATK